MKPQRGLELLPAVGEPAELGEGRAHHPVRRDQGHGVAASFSSALELLRDIVRGSQLPALHVEHGLAVKNWQELRWIAEPAAQLARAGVGSAGLGCGEAPGRDRGLAQGELRLQLAPLPVRTVWETLERCQALGQLRRGLCHGAAGESLLPGQVPIVRSPLKEPGVGAMASQELRLLACRLREVLLQRRRDAPMQCLALRPEQALVGSVSDQGVDLGSLAFKGVPKPIPCFEVVRERPAGSRFDAQRAGVPLPMVGA
jgi:hypothetical protein